MAFYNTLHYLVGSVGPHLTTFVTFPHLTSAGLNQGLILSCPAAYIFNSWKEYTHLRNCQGSILPESANTAVLEFRQQEVLSSV
jgi:hypothetical protein